MKRIDDKIKEIEKKDKTNRIIFIVVLAIVAAWYVFVTQKTIQQQEITISELEIKNSDTYKELEAEKEKSDFTLSELQKSLRPLVYWQYIRNENTVESYISYITNNWGIEKPASAIQEAHNNLRSANVEGYSGWLFVGAKTSDGTYTSRDIIEVIYREGADGDIANSEPRVGDIVRLKSTRNRLTYARNNEGRRNEQGFRNKTKAYIADVWDDPNSTNIEIFIKYY